MHMASASDGLPSVPEPLTHRRPDGTLYERQRHVDLQIAATLALPLEELLNRAHLEDVDSPDHLHEETLVYLIRAFHAVQENDVVANLAQELLRRSTPLLKSHFRSLDQEDAADAAGETIEELFKQMLDRNSDRGDFLQVRYRMALKRLAISAFRRYSTMINDDQAMTVPLTAVAGYQDRDDEDQTTRAIPLDALRAPTSLPDQTMLANEALAMLSEPQRTAYLLFYYEGWQIDSKNPEMPTISKFFGRTPKTIYNWLVAAEKTLEEWRGNTK